MAKSLTRTGSSRQNLADCPDIELISFCCEVDALERRILIAALNIQNASNRDKITTPLYRRQDMLLDKIHGKTPQTLAGCKAVASILSLWTRFHDQTVIDRNLLELLLTGLETLKS